MESLCDVDEFREESIPWLAECGRVLSLSIPITLSEVLTYFGYLVTTAQVGNIGLEYWKSRQLSALTLGRSVFHLTGLSL